LSTKKNRVPTVINSLGSPVTRVKIPFTRVQPPLHLDDETRKFLTDVQDNVESATEAQRSDPTQNMVIVQQAINVESVPSGSHVRALVRHGLGQAFTGYRCTRTYAQTKGGLRSQPFAAVESLNNANQDPTQYIVLDMTSIGLYDLEIFA
jgi:hypothetical protein